MGRIMGGVVVVAVAVLVVAAWHFRGRLQMSVTPAPQALHAAPPTVQQKPDVLYTWVDKEGVTHFEQKAGRGSRVEYDGSRITPLVPVDTKPLTQGKVTVAAAKEQASQGLHKLRKELEDGAQRMRESRAAASGNL